MYMIDPGDPLYISEQVFETMVSLILQGKLI